MPRDTDVAAPAAVAFQTKAKVLEEDMLRALSEPRPSNGLLVALVRGLVQLGQVPHLEVVRAVAAHLSDSKDAESSEVKAL